MNGTDIEMPGSTALDQHVKRGPWSAVSLSLPFTVRGSRVGVTLRIDFVAPPLALRPERQAHRVFAVAGMPRGRFPPSSGVRYGLIPAPDRPGAKRRLGLDV